MVDDLDYYVRVEGPHCFGLLSMNTLRQARVLRRK